MIHYYYSLQFQKPETADQMQLDERQTLTRVVVEDTPLLSEVYVFGKKPKFYSSCYLILLFRKKTKESMCLQSVNSIL